MRTQIQIGLAAVIAAALLATAVASAQRGGGAAGAGAQAGQRQGGAAANGEQPLGRGAFQPTVWWGDEMFPKWPYPAGDAAYADLDGVKIKGYINEITAIARKSRDDGNQYWGRITGSPYDKMTTDWVQAQFKRVGLEQVRSQEFTDLPPQWWPTSWEVTAAGGGKTLELKTAFPLYHSVGTNGQADLEPVWVGMGTPADFQGRDVRGKAVIAYGFPNPGGREDTALTFGIVKRADEAGAAALFIVLGFPGNVMNEPTAGGTTDPARMPIFMLGNQDGTAVRQMIEAERVTEDPLPSRGGAEDRPEDRERLGRAVRRNRREHRRDGPHRLLLRGGDGQRVRRRHDGRARRALREDPEGAASPHDDVPDDVGTSLALG